MPHPSIRPNASPHPPNATGSLETPVVLRFEDVAQDGRLVLEALPNAIGPAVWGRLLAHDPLAIACRQKGIVPILSRLSLEGTAGPFSVAAEVTSELRYQIAPIEDDRLVLDVWAELFARTGRTHTGLAGLSPQPETDGEMRMVAGRVFAEHAFTKPFAPAGQRRVTRSDLEGALPPLAPRVPLVAADAMTVLPDGARPLEPGLRVDPWPVTFGVVHTDSNHHVNSLVYLRVFEEAALRRFAELGVHDRPIGLGRRIDIAYRKPCFAGQSMRVVEQAFAYAGGVGVVAALVLHEAGTTDDALLRARPHVYARMWFMP